MVLRKPIVYISGVSSELPPGDLVEGASATTSINAGSGLSGGGSLSSNVQLDINLAPNASGIIFVGDALGLDGVAQATASSALSSGNSALTLGASAQASGNAGIAAAVTKLPLSGGVVSGQYAQNVVSLGLNGSGINTQLGNYFTATISGNSTITFTNTPSSVSYSFTYEVNHQTGTITWPTAVQWPSNTAPSLTTGRTHLFMFVTDDNGSRWRGASLIDYIT